MTVTLKEYFSNAFYRALRFLSTVEDRHSSMNAGDSDAQQAEMECRDVAETYDPFRKCFRCLLMH